MGGACQAPVSHLLLFSPQRNSIKNPKNFSKIPLPLNSRRFFLFSLPLLLPISIKPTSWSDAFAASYDPLTLAEKNDSAALSKRVSEALELLEKGRELQAVGDFKNALDYFTLVSSLSFLFYFLFGF